MIKVPYSVVSPQVLKRWSTKIEGISNRLKVFFPRLKANLKFAEFDIEDQDYLSMCLISSFIWIAFFFVLFLLVLAKFQLKNFPVVSFIIALVFGLFIFIQQLNYPRLVASKRVRSIEQNLMAALQNILIQINSGVPLFDTLVNIAYGSYGEISVEFKKAIKRIAAGEDEISALEEIATLNPSTFFRRSIWQLVNGMKAGGDISRVLEDVIHALSEEQLISIQKYGSQLNPLAMFYMLIAVIMPALGITFIIVLSSFVSLSEDITKAIFYFLIGFVAFFQIMFLGVIKSRRPNLMT